MSIVIDGSIYFDRMYRKYIRFRKDLRVQRTNAMLMNPISIAIDYICYTITNLDILLKKYTFKVIYLNVNHRIGLINRSANKKRANDKRLARMFKDMIYLMETGDISGTYMRYHEYFRENLQSYRLKDIDDRRTGYDYNNDLPRMELAFIREALIEQNQLSPNDLYFCNRIILSMLTNTRVIYTETSNIDYLKYHKARFIRSRNWRHYRRKESIVKVRPLDRSLYSHFKETRVLPLIDCCQTNSYDLFILTDDPYKMYVKHETSLFMDEGLLDDYIEVIELLESREEATPMDPIVDPVNALTPLVVSTDTITDPSDRYSFIESIEPTEIMESDVNIIIDSIIKRWSEAYSEFDLRKLKIAIERPNDRPERSISVNNISEIIIDGLVEIV